jgi:tetratricopeptide (TPR) repeat protein
MPMSRLFPALALALAFLCGACSRSPQYYLDKGNRLAAAGKYDDALLNYRKAIQADPNNGDAYYQVGLAMVRLRRTAEAYSTLSRAGELLPGRDDVQVKLADFILTSYLADRRRPQTLYDKVNVISNRLLAKDADSYDGLRLQAHLLASSRKYREAEEAYRKANQAKPMQPEVVMGWTQALLQDGQAEDGERLALQLIEKDKTYGPVYDLLYQHYMAANRRGDAENILKTKVNNNPADAASALELAAFYGTASREAEMQAALQRMLNQTRVFPDALLQTGDLYARLQRWNDALHQYQEGARTDPKRRIVYLKKVADVWLTLGQGEKADSVVTEILKQQPDDAAAKGIRASLLLASRKPESVGQAVSILQALVQTEPDNAIWHFNLGRGLAAKGDLNGARIQFQEAVQKRPGLLPPRLALIQLSQDRGDFKAALQYANEILALYPGLPRVKLARAVALMYTGKDEEARTELMNLEKAFPRDREV